MLSGCNGKFMTIPARPARLRETQHPHLPALVCGADYVLAILMNTRTVRTTFIILMYFNGGCSSPMLVTASALPDTICSGSCTNLSSTPGGGNGGPYTYSWCPFRRVLLFRSKPRASLHYRHHRFYSNRKRWQQFSQGYVRVYVNTCLLPIRNR